MNARLRGAATSVSDRPILMGGAPHRGHHQRHAGRRRGPGPATVEFPAWCCGSPAIRWRCGCQTSIRSSWPCSRAIKHRPLLDGEEDAMLNLAEYRQRPRLADWLPLGDWLRRASS